MRHALVAATAALFFFFACGDTTNTHTDGGTVKDAGAGGGSGGGTGGGSGTATAAEVGAATAQFQCQVLGCLLGFSPDFCGQPGAAGSFGSFLGSSFDPTSSVGAGRMTYDATRGATCLATLQSLQGLSCYGENPPLFAAVDGSADPCAGAFTGNVANGSSCYDSQECAVGYCDFGAAACPGTCAPRLANGAACENDGDCQVGSECAWGSGSGKVCQPEPIPLAKGATCSGGAGTCADGLYCGTSGTCTDVKLADGATCTENEACGADSTCAKASMFDPTGTCTAKAGAGEPCSTGGVFIFFMSSECKGGQLCAGLITDGGTVTQQGHCQAPADVGATCFPAAAGTAGGTGCYTDRVCNPATGKCVELPAPGAACIAGRCGANAYCNATNDTCAAKKADGASCTSGDECVNKCDDTTGSPTYGKCYTAPDTTCHP